jgi:hypothetical protein
MLFTERLDRAPGDRLDDGGRVVSAAASHLSPWDLSRREPRSSELSGAVLLVVAGTARLPTGGDNLKPENDFAPPVPHPRRVRLLTATRRRLFGAALIAGVCAASAAPHNHSFDELLGGPSATGEQAVTTHDPHSRASHWHAVIRFVKENPCLACQWHRLAGASAVAGVVSPTLSVLHAALAAPASLRSAFLGRPSSRAPPTLLLSA